MQAPLKPHFKMHHPVRFSSKDKIAPQVDYSYSFPIEFLFMSCIDV